MSEEMKVASEAVQSPEPSSPPERKEPTLRDLRIALTEQVIEIGKAEYTHQQNMQKMCANVDALNGMINKKQEQLKAEMEAKQAPEGGAA
jgi:hypothetical protein